MNQICTYILVLFFAAHTTTAQVFWSEDFSGDTLPENWITEDANPGTSNVIWEICSTPGNCTPANLVNSPFQSETVANGYAIVDSDAAGPISPGNHVSRLTTPAIDCSNQDQVFLEFQSFILTASLNAAENAIIRVWTDTDTLILKPYPQLFQNDSNEDSKNPEILNFNISDIAANQATVHIQWEWTGNYEYFWCIDDVRLSSVDMITPPRTVWFERFHNGGEGWEVYPDTLEAKWAWDPFGDLSNSVLYYTSDPIRSASAHDGVMMFNADYYTFMGEQSEGPYPHYQSELWSPVIDLSTVTSPVALHFTQLVNKLNEAPNAPTNNDGQKLFSSFQYSIDGGETWSDPIDANPTLGVQEMYYSTETFPLEGLEGQANVRLKFTFAGDLFFWVLDDIALVERAQYDLTLNSEFYAIMPNAITPISQVSEEIFAASIRNPGLSAAEGSQLNLSIEEEESGLIIYQESEALGTLEPGFSANNIVLETRLDPMPIQNTGTYKGTYSVSLDSTDAIPDNNEIPWFFEISDTTFAKETGYTSNASASISSEIDYSFTYGNVYYVPNGSDYQATSISFGIWNTMELEGRTVNAYIYKLIGDLNDDLFIQENERIGPIGFYSYAFEGTEGRSLITVPVNPDFEPIPLEDSASYITVIEYTTTDTQQIYFNTSDEYNYELTWLASDSVGARRYISVVDVGNSGTFNPAGFGFNVVPQVRLNIQLILDDTEQDIFETAKITIGPNPTKDVLNLWFDLGEKVEELQVLIRDSSGKIVNSKKFSDIQQKELTFDARKWPSGLYLLELQSGTSLYNKKFIIQN
jgi:hypothetical protein